MYILIFNFQYIFILSLTLRDRFDSNTINKACTRALRYGALSYKVVKSICEKGLSDLPTYEDESYVNESETEIYRDIREYDKLLYSGEIKK